MNIKKIRIVLFLFLGICFFQSSSMVFGTAMDSQQTNVAVELWEPIVPEKVLPGEVTPSAQLTQASSSSKHNQIFLPQTGEVTNHWYSCLGIFLIILVSTLFYSKINQKKKY